MRMHPQAKLNTGRNRPGELDESPTPDWNQVASEYMAKKQGDLPPHPLDGLPAWSRQSHRPLNSWEPGELTKRDEWHAVMTPKPVAARWDAVLAAVEAVEESSAKVKAIQAEEAAERDRYDAAVVAAIQAGEEVPEPDKVTDWTTERVKREAIDRTRQNLVREARRAYEDAVREATPAWRAAVEAELPKLRAAAEKVVRAARPAVVELAAAHGVLAAMADEATPQRRDADAVQQARAAAEHHRGASAAARSGLDRITAVLHA
jgi:hypothetical protein